jgi:hypothetical protein
MFTPASRLDSGTAVLFEIYGLAAGGKTPRRSARKGYKNQPSRKPNDPRRVLMYGRLLELALYRAEVLRGRGFSVITPRNKAEAISAIEDGEFDTLVVSYTLSSDTAEEIVELARQKCPGCPIITISETGKVDRRLRPDVVVRANEGPSGLIKALERAFRSH